MILLKQARAYAMMYRVTGIKMYLDNARKCVRLYKKQNEVTKTIQFDLFVA